MVKMSTGLKNSDRGHILPSIQHYGDRMNTRRPSWEQTYMTMCYQIARRSRDLSTHSGTVITTSDHVPVSFGYNSFPRGIDFEGEIGKDGLPSRQSRIDGEKYHWMEHGERNAIYNACRNGASMVGARLYVNWVPCTDCARAIIQTGISEVIIHKQGQMAFDHSRLPDGSMWTAEEADKWDASHQKSWGMMEETGITVKWYDGILDGDVRSGYELRYSSTYSAHWSGCSCRNRWWVSQSSPSPV